MESPVIKLSPTGTVMSANAPLWTWEILLKKKMIASGTSLGTQPIRPPVSAAKNSVPGSVSETGSMSAWGACSLVQIVSTTHTLKLYWSRDTRCSSAISKTCLPIFSSSAVSDRATKAKEANSVRCLCSKKLRSRLGYWRPVRCLRGEHAVWSR